MYKKSLAPECKIKSILYNRDARSLDRADIEENVGKSNQEERIKLTILQKNRLFKDRHGNDQEVYNTMTHKKSTLQRFMKDRRNLQEFPDRM